MEVITTLTLEDIHKILLDEMRHWRMHFKITLDKWLMMVGCKAIENETGEGTFSRIYNEAEGKDFDYCGICNFISEAKKNGTNEKVLFYWDYDADKKEHTLTDIDVPGWLRWGSILASCKPFCRETEIHICKLAQSLGREPHCKEKRPIERWLIKAAKPVLTKECGDWFEVELNETAFPICTQEEAIDALNRANPGESVSFIYGKNEEHKECTVTKVILPESLKDALRETRGCKKTELPKCKHGEVLIKSDSKLYIDFQTCARCMAFVDETDDDKRQLEDWIINACYPIIKKDCNNAKLLEADFRPFKDPDKFICKAEAMGILLDGDRFPAESEIVIEYECDPNGIHIHAPKLLTEDEKELAALDLYSEPIMWLPKDRWIDVHRKEKLIPSNEIIEGFWLVKSDHVMAYHEWLMCAAGTAMHINLGGGDTRTNWNENEAPITWHDALEKLMADCDSSDEFKVAYSLRLLLDDRGAYSYRELNIYSCEPVKK